MITDKILHGRKVFQLKIGSQKNAYIYQRVI